MQEMGRYIPTSLRRLLKSMKDPFYDWLGSPFDGGLVYNEEERREIEERYDIKINTRQIGYNYFLGQPVYKVTVQKAEQVISYNSNQDIPKKWPIRLRLKKQPKNKK